MPILLKNTTKELKCYVLDHVELRSAPEPFGYTTLERRRAATAPDGTTGIKVEKKMIPASLSLFGGQQMQVPSAVSKVPQVKADIDGGILRMVEIPEPADGPSKKASAPSAGRTKKKRTSKRGKK